MDYFPEVEFGAPQAPEIFAPEILFIPQTPPALALGLGFGVVLGMVVALFVILFVCYILTHTTVPLSLGGVADQGLELQPVDDLELQPVGVDRALRHNMPRFIYSSAALTETPYGEQICVLCQDELVDGDSMSIIPPCSHVVHTSCIDDYMDTAIICPCCRTIISLGSTSHPTATTSL